MLIEFRAKNHRSLRDECGLTMEAFRGGDKDDPRPRRVKGHSKSLLPVAALYGPNASGKSNVLSAFAFMREAVLQSYSEWPADGGVPRDPYAWGPQAREDSLFEVEFVSEGIRCQYGFTASDERILEEWLYAWPHGKKQTWFSRAGDKLKLNDQLKGSSKLVVEANRPNSLLLSAMMQHGQLGPQLRFVMHWFKSTKAVGIVSWRSLNYPDFQTVWELRRLLKSQNDASEPRRFSTGYSPEQAAATLDRFRGLLQGADTGITDFRIIESDAEESLKSRFQFKHQSDAQDAWLAFGEESKGTQTLFRVALPIIHALDRGGVLIVDELEASLHPSLARKMIRQFNNPATNPHHAQLIFTTHDTNLLGPTPGLGLPGLPFGEPELRRDQVWLTEKDEKGATSLYPLTDYKARKNENIEIGYLQGRYGAIPFLGDFPTEKSKDVAITPKP